MRALIRQSSGGRRASSGAATNEDERRTGQAGPRASTETETLKMDEVSGGGGSKGSFNQYWEDSEPEWQARRGGKKPRGGCR
ncbi:hypothetical protein VULLAG_LOCUS6552 [Vulpes lagopus]